MQNAGVRVRNTARSFLVELKKSSEIGYQVLFGLFIFSFYLRRIYWIPFIAEAIPQIWLGVFSVMLWGAAIYLYLVLYNWKEFAKSTPRLIISAVLLAGITILFAKVMNSDQYMLVMDFYFCLMAYGKNYKKILQCYLIVAVVTLIVAAAGLKLGYSLDMVKPENASPGHSFGIIYPNDWGHIGFLIIVVIWYLYLRGKALITFALFWGAALFMFFVVSCRTVALLALVFPMMVIAVEWLEKRPRKNKGRIGVIGAILIVMPILGFGLSILLGWQLVWVHKMFYHTPLHTWAMRFVQGGMAMRYFGLPLIGHEMYVPGLVTTVINGETVALEVMDNAYISYSIMRGTIWMTGCLLWLCLANHRSLKKGDFRLLLISGFMTVFAMMEWAGLNVWYNFVLMYPLAAICEAKPEDDQAT